MNVSPPRLTENDREPLREDLREPLREQIPATLRAALNDISPAFVQHPLPDPGRDPAPMLEATREAWGGKTDLWVFGYASLIWRPDFAVAEQRLANVHGWHRALKMWSRVNRGTPACPGLVFALLSGGSCQGMVLRVPHADAHEVLQKLWHREMVTGVYDPKWLHCTTHSGPVRALAFTLSRKSRNFTGDLQDAQYQQIFSEACGRYGTTLDYARQTFLGLKEHGIHDHALERLLLHAPG